MSEAWGATTRNVLPNQASGVHEKDFHLLGETPRLPPNCTAVFGKKGSRSWTPKPFDILMGMANQAEQEKGDAVRRDPYESSRDYRAWLAQADSEGRTTPNHATATTTRAGGLHSRRHLLHPRGHS